MLKKIIKILLIFFLHSVVTAEETPEVSLKKSKLLCEAKIKGANQELAAAKKTLIKAIKLAKKEYDEALEEVKIHYTKKGDLRKALSFKELQEDLRFKSIYEYIPTIKSPVNKPEIKEPDPFEPPQVTNQPEEIDTQPEPTSNNTTEIDKTPDNDTKIIKRNTRDGSINNFENTTNIENNINIDPEEVIKTLSFNEKSLKDYGFAVNDSCISGPLLEGDETLFLSNTTYKFNGKCEYCFKIKGRWYHGGILMIDDKVYSMSYGHWANNGARIITKGQIENTNNGAKIIENDQVMTKLKGKEYKVARYSKEWNELKIVIENGNISYFYNGNEIHKDSVDIQKGSKLQFGFSTYRSETELKDFSLKLN